MLEVIQDFRHLIPTGTNFIETHSGKLAHCSMGGSDFELVLDKIASEGIANFKETPGNSAEGWGTNRLMISDINWDKLEEYMDGLKVEEEKQKPI